MAGSSPAMTRKTGRFDVLENALNQSDNKRGGVPDRCPERLGHYRSGAVTAPTTPVAMPVAALTALPAT